MLQMYQGKIEQGRFIPVDSIPIPDMSEVYLVFERKKMEQPKTLAQRQNEALKEFSAAIKEISDETLDETFDANVNKRFNITRGLNL
jgi:hypothetical protein